MKFEKVVTASVLSAQLFNTLHAYAQQGVVITPQAATTVIGGSGLIVNTNNATALLHACGTYTTLGITTATTLQIVPGASGQTIYVCDFDISVATGTATNIQFAIGTGTNCATGSTTLGQVWYAGALNWGKIGPNLFYRGMNSGAVASASLCVTNSATATISIGLYYDKY